MSEARHRLSPGVPESRVASRAAVGFAVVWLLGVVVFPVWLSRTGVGDSGVADLRDHPVLGIIHFALIGGAAPILGIVAATPTVRRLGSTDTSFAAAFAGIAACVASLMQLNVGAVLVASRPGADGDQALVSTLHDLDGLKAALFAVALAVVIWERWSWNVVMTPRILLFAATVTSLILYAVGSIGEITALDRSVWVALPLTLITVCELSGESVHAGR